MPLLGRVPGSPRVAHSASDPHCVPGRSAQDQLDGKMGSWYPLPTTVYFRQRKAREWRCGYIQRMTARKADAVGSALGLKGAAGRWTSWRWEAMAGQDSVRGGSSLRVAHRKSGRNLRISRRRSLSTGHGGMSMVALLVFPRQGMQRLAECGLVSEMVLWRKRNKVLRSAIPSRSCT